MNTPPPNYHRRAVGLVLTVGFFLVIVADVLTPVALPLLAWRRSRRLRHAIVAFLLGATVVPFLLTGGLAWAFTLIDQCVVEGKGLSDAHPVAWTVGGYILYSFAVCGLYGAAFAVAGLMLTAPAMGLWRVLHARSFRRAFGMGGGGAA